MASPRSKPSSIDAQPGRILGIDDEVGTIEGKMATMFLSEGDALDMRTNGLTQAWIEGGRRPRQPPASALRKFQTKYGAEVLDSPTPRVRTNQ